VCFGVDKAESKKAKPSSRLRSAAFEKNINKRGKVVTKDKTAKSQLGPIVIGFFLFVVVGSALFQIIRTAQMGTGTRL